MSTTIHLVRHGEVYNPDRIYYGRKPLFRLSEQGQQQAQYAGDYFKTRPLAALYTSPLLRARQTAKLIAEAHAVPINPQITQQLIEVHSPYDGWPLEVLEARQWDLYTDSSADYEQPTDLVARIQTFFDRVRLNHRGQEVMAVTHGDIIVFATVWAHGLPAKQYSKSRLATILPEYYPANCGIASFTFADDEPATLPHYAYFRPY